MLHNSYNLLNQNYPSVHWRINHIVIILIQCRSPKGDPILFSPEIFKTLLKISLYLNQIRMKTKDPSPNPPTRNPPFEVVNPLTWYVWRHARWLYIWHRWWYARWLTRWHRWWCARWKDGWFSWLLTRWFVRWLVGRLAIWYTRWHRRCIEDGIEDGILHHLRTLGGMLGRK